MRTFMQKLILQIVLIFIIGMALHVIPVHADGERTAFGSESYQWEQGVDSPIGIYAHAAQGVRTTEIYVQYDETMLEYNAGGEQIEPGLIRMIGNGSNAVVYQQMLQFTPLISGKTQITIQESSITDSVGELHTTQAIHVPVDIVLPSDWQLESMQLNGIEIEDFQVNTIEYDVEMNGEVEQIDITVLPNDFHVEASKNTLDIGNNDIYIVVTNTAGQKVRYKLQINRSDELTDGENRTDGETQEAQVMVQGTHTEGIAKRNQALLYVLLIVLLIVLVVLIVVKFRMSKTNEQNKRIINTDEELLILEWDEELSQDDLQGERTDTVIAVNHVVMDFKREKDEATSVKEHVIRTVKGQHSYEMFRALDDISFRIHTGEVVGIIGTNGSGKSTILKIISGVLAPTTGSVQVDRAKIQLLTLGTGFDMELTGRENVYLNGALIGYTKEYIDKHYDEIVKFAELEGFMEEKVRNYSSGMVSRLGFAIATIRDTPEILILDEVLSVGDMFFRKKSEERIKKMIHGGSTVLIVSHSTSTIRNNCTKAIWIEKSKLKAVGDAKKVCDAYEKMNEVG
jgi:ABC-type polysaccharide/polyol phosphate transport system, ATPase component